MPTYPNVKILNISLTIVLIVILEDNIYLYVVKRNTPHIMSTKLTPEEILRIITDNFLCVRRLPFKVVSVYAYREGDENKLGGLNGKPMYGADGKEIKNIKREIVTGYGNWDKDKKFIKDTKTVEKGGWFLVQPVNSTSSTVRFDLKHDFVAPTLEEAILLYLDSKK